MTAEKVAHCSADRYPELPPIVVDDKRYAFVDASLVLSTGYLVDEEQVDVWHLGHRYLGVELYIVLLT